MFRLTSSLAVLCLFMLAGCEAPAPTTPTTPTSTAASDGSTTPEARGTIGFSALTLKNPFFKIIADSLTEAGQAQGFDVIVNDAERDVSTQAKHIDNYIAQGVTAIVINPTDQTAIGPAVKKANEAGIPVFTCDLQCTDADAQITAHIGTDNYQGGRLAGQAMIEALGDAGGDVLVLHFKQASSCVKRVAGFTDEINEYNTGKEEGKINVVAELEGGGLQDEGFRTTLDALQQHPNLAGIFAINDPSALGAYTALEQSKKADQVKIVGFDGQKEGLEAIRDGKIYADPIQFPKKMGSVTVENIMKYLDGEPIEKVQLIPTKLYRQEDAKADPELE